MLKTIPATMVCFFMASGALAAPEDACPTMANGRWIIASIRRPMGITGLSYDEAKAYLGKEVFVSDRKLAFNGRSCEGATKSITRSVDEPGSEPGFPYRVLYTCPGGDDSLIPPITVGKSCDKALIDIDATILVLRRKELE